jgi:hypothetical protein
VVGKMTQSLDISARQAGRFLGFDGDSPALAPHQMWVCSAAKRSPALSSATALVTRDEKKYPKVENHKIVGTIWIGIRNTP